MAAAVSARASSKRPSMSSVWPRVPSHTVILTDPVESSTRPLAFEQQDHGAAQDCGARCLGDLGEMGERSLRFNLDLSPFGRRFGFSAGFVELDGFSRRLRGCDGGGRDRVAMARLRRLVAQKEVAEESGIRRASGARALGAMGEFFWCRRRGGHFGFGCEGRAVKPQPAEIQGDPQLGGQISNSVGPRGSRARSKLIQGHAPQGDESTHLPAMNLPHSIPDPAGTERAQRAKDLRDLATEQARRRPNPVTLANGEEQDLGPTYPTNFTKGLYHDENGLLAEAEDYRGFVEAINSHDRHLFENGVTNAEERLEASDPVADLFHCTVEGEAPRWRGWESPRAGHVYELEGPDAGAVGMAPAPRVGSSELAAEMAEVYALGVLRDVPFTTLREGGGERLCASQKSAGQAELSAQEAVDALNSMPFFGGGTPSSSTPHCEGLNRFERHRRQARTLSVDGSVTLQNAFRGSTKGAQAGPYISQFLLIGSDSLAGTDGTKSSFPGRDAEFGLADGFVSYGSQSVDQRALTHRNCLDYMTDWASWRDVQNGANVGGARLFEPERRFITTPRDLATYVHFDALYQSYLNATLILLGMGTPASKGFPEPSPSGKRTPFATFGGPHILSLVTEVATRCLKAVRRQKFNYHRRARPEALAGRLTLAEAGHGELLSGGRAEPHAAGVFADLLAELPASILDAVRRHNKSQNASSKGKLRPVKCADGFAGAPAGVGPENILLPMAFAEGSPMHPAYGAGHATVAGGCVTMLKAFFEMFEDGDGRRLRELRTSNGRAIALVPDATGAKLIKDKATKGALTIEGELDKLAANISIGRNMAGVHYYSDYYDSARMGERLAVGILMEQAPTYGDALEVTFHSFDGDLITIQADAGEAPRLCVMSAAGDPVTPSEWWLRHVPGEEDVLDL